MEKLTCACTVCGGRLTMLNVPGGVGPKWMHDDGPTDHDPTPNDEMTQLAAALLFDVARVQLLLRTGGSTSTLTAIWLPSLILKAEKFLDAARRHDPSAIPAIHPPEIHDMERRVYMSSGAIPPPVEN